MIRVSAILCKLISLNLSDKQLFDLYLSNTDVHHQRCPYCGSTGPHEFHSRYSRYMITFQDNQRVDFEVSINRIKCNCGHTHALIPDILIPYSSYSLRFILTILYLYSVRNCSVTDFCDKHHIAVSTLYDWIHLFVDHYNLWIGALNEIASLTVASVSEMFSAEPFTSDFFERFRFSFLQAGFASFSDSA